MSKENQGAPEAPQKMIELPLFKFEEEQILQLKYNPKIHMFVTHRSFDTTCKKLFYFGRVFKADQIEQNFTKFAECELESVLTPAQEEELNRFQIEDLEKQQAVRQILGELAGAASLCWVEKPSSEFDSSAAAGFCDEAFAKILAVLQPREGESVRNPRIKKDEDLPAAVLASIEKSVNASE